MTSEKAARSGVTVKRWEIASLNRGDVAATCSWELKRARCPLGDGGGAYSLLSCLVSSRRWKGAHGARSSEVCYAVPMVLREQAG